MKECYIRFMAPVIPQTSDQLLRIIDQKIAQKFEKLHLMISSPGGSVFHGLSIYNYLKGAPIKIDTYNFGSVDSIGVVIYCAGEKRFSVPHSRFLLHGVRFNFNGNVSLDEKQIEEHLNGLKIDQLNIARVIADNTGKSTDKIFEDMNNRTTLNPTEAKDYGLTHEISSNLLPVNADLSIIYEPQKNNPIIQNIPISIPRAQSYTRSQELDFST